MLGPIVGSLLVTIFGSPVLDVALALIVATVVLAAKDRITARLAFRNATRRKVAVLLVVFGLFIGTAMISGSLVTSDTLNSVVTRTAFSAFGGIDEGVYHTGVSGLPNFFNYSVYDQYRETLLGIPNVVGVTPMIVWSGALFDSKTRVGQPGVSLIGVYPNASSVLGDFQDSSGKVIPLSEGGVILNVMAARDLNASVGDSVVVYAGQNSSTFAVEGIDDSFARAGFPCCGDHAVISLTSAQSLIGAKGEINYVAITNSGGIEGGIAHTREVGSQANSTLAPASLQAFGDKNNTVASLSEAARTFSSIFVVLSSFTIIAGSVLIVNIFVMLAEERKKEMGMARAVGMKRAQLTKLFLFEGMQYSLASSLVGVFAGIGIAYAIVYALGALLIVILPTLSVGAILEGFTVTPGSLITSFSVGFLLTYLTILFASWRVSKLNIIRAIRGTPEPPHSRRTYTKLMVAGVVAVVLGAFITVEAKSTGDAAFFLAGPAIALLASGLVLARFVKLRFAITASTLASLVYWGIPELSWDSPVRPSLSSSDITPFILGGCFMVVASVLLVAFNTDAIMRVTALVFKSRPKWVPVFQVGMSYPGNKRFRTAVAIFMFALVMFTVVAVSIMTNLSNTSNGQAALAASGGYDLIAYAQSPVHGLESLVRGDPNVSSSIRSFVTFNGGYATVTDGRLHNSTVVLYVGADSSAPAQDNFFVDNQYNVTNATRNYVLPDGRVNASKVWDAVRSNSSDVVLSTSSFGSGGGGSISLNALPGDVLEVSLPNGTSASVTVIAIMNGVTVQGIITTSQAISDLFHVSDPSYALVSLKGSASASDVAISLKRDFLRYGVQVENVQTTIDQILATQVLLFSVFQGFLGLGLVVGIAGLSIIAVRSVVERRQEIGMLRALGFTRSMILRSFVLENSFISLLGIAIGALVAFALGYAIVSSGVLGSVPYVIPWLGIVELCAGAYVCALAGTSWSALRASRILPAQALRYVE
jgi:putative ABC transport system permease protein